MINLQAEKQYKIPTQDVYDIVSYAIDAADDSGFINTFVLERALYEYAILDIYEDSRDKYQKKIASNPNMAWDEMLKDGLVDKLHEEYANDISHLADVAAQWVDDYESYAHSIRGAADAIQNSLDLVSDNALKNFKETVSDEALNEVSDIADKWGMNNVPEKEKSDIKLVDDDDTSSLFVK